MKAIDLNGAAIDMKAGVPAACAHDRSSHAACSRGLRERRVPTLDESIAFRAKFRRPSE
jgi:hypothetical protein